MRDFFQVLYKPLPNVSYIYIDFIAGLLEGQAEVCMMPVTVTWTVRCVFMHICGMDAYDHCGE